jgi:hypothetical protein
MSENDDVRALEPGPLAKAAAAIQVVCGLYVVLSAVQLLISLEFYGPLTIVQHLNEALVALGVLQVWLAAGTYRVKLVHTAAAAVLAGLVAPVVTGWAVVCLAVEIFSCMQAGAVLLAWSAALLSPFVVGHARKAEVVRKKLAADGMDLGT